jgi:hypothetical protein
MSDTNLMPALIMAAGMVIAGCFVFDEFAKTRANS